MQMRITGESAYLCGGDQDTVLRRASDGLLNARSNDLRGIVNGIDYDEYNRRRMLFYC